MPDNEQKNQIDDRFHELNLRLDDFWLEQFKYYENDKKTHEELRSIVAEMTKSIKPLMIVFDTTTTVAKFTVYVLKGFGFLAGIVTVGYAAYQIIKQVNK